MIEVFEKAKRESEKTSKNGLAMYLKVHLETFKLFLDEKTFTRYHDSFVTGIKKEVNPDTDTLDKLSQYIGYKNFTDFSNTFIKKDENTNKTTVKVSVDHDEESITEKLSKIIINITNEQHFKMPDFIKKNGMGILEMTFVILLATGGVVFSNPKNANRLGIMSGLNSPATYKPFMYWDKDRYIATDSSYLGPQIEVVPMDSGNFTYLKKITRPDTLTVDNALHKVWYDKSANEVEFFTSFGKHPENGKTLKEATPYIISTYGGE